MLHIQFVLRYIFFGVTELSFFQFVITYDFTRDIAIIGLIFTIASAYSFAICYMFFYKKDNIIDEYHIIRIKKIELLALNITGSLMILYMMIVIYLAKFDYIAMTVIRENNGFIFELRLIYLIFLSYILLNIPIKDFLKYKKYRTTVAIMLIYLLSALAFQARAVVFEFFVIFLFSQLMWFGDKVKIKYVVIMFISMILPNLIVLGRLGIPDNSWDLIAGIFSFEYSMEINNFLSAAIQDIDLLTEHISLTSTLYLLIPSIIRDFLDISLIRPSYYREISISAGNGGGGFSLLADMYLNFGWYSPVIFGLFGSLIGRLNYLATKVGFVSLRYAGAPLIYSCFILTLRNDLGVFLKYTFQVILIMWVLHIIFRRVKIV